MNALTLLVRAGTMLAVLAGTPRAEAEAARPCAERAEIVARLAERFGETLRSVGLQGGDAVVEVYSSEATGTWTILMTRPDGITCLLAAGERWEQAVKPITAPGRDA
jgi:predicted methyltransferase